MCVIPPLDVQVLELLVVCPAIVFREMVGCRKIPALILSWSLVLEHNLKYMRFLTCCRWKPVIIAVTIWLWMEEKENPCQLWLRKEVKVFLHCLSVKSRGTVEDWFYLQWCSFSLFSDIWGVVVELHFPGPSINRNTIFYSWGNFSLGFRYSPMVFFSVSSVL